MEKVIAGRIYGIINLVNGKIYVGQTTQSLKQRFGQHARAKSYIGNAIRKYGRENFVCEIIEECTTLEELDERERFWIAEFDCIYPKGYNRTPGGDSVRGGSPALNAKRSAAMKKVWATRSPDERSNMAKNREAAKTPEERSATARKSAATRIANSTPEERSATAIARERAKSPEKRAEADRKAGLSRKKYMAKKSLEERRQITAKAREVSMARTAEEKSAAANKAWATRRDRAAEKQRLIKNLIDLIKKLF